MTYGEYKKLYGEWSSTDSVSHKDEIKDAIYDAAVGLLHKLVELYAKRGRDYVGDSDYRTDRGFTSLDAEELPWDGETKVHLRYTDSWRYGGECDIGIIVPMKYLDEDEFGKLDEELKKKQLVTLEHDLRSKKAEVEHLTKSIGEIEVKIAELRKETEK